MYIEKQDIAELVKATYPDYTGRKFKVQTATKYRLSNYWDGGTKNFAKFAKYENGWKVLPAPATTTDPFNGIAHATMDIPKNGLVVEHSIFCGKDAGITVYLHPESEYLPKFLPAEKSILTREEKIVLAAIRTYKSSYAGVSNYRYHAAHRETGISLTAYEGAKSRLIEAGYLTRAGAITLKGRNTIGTTDIYQLKGE